MERSLELLELLNTLIITIEDNTISINKDTLKSVLTCLQVTQDKVRLLQAQSQLLNDEIRDLKNQSVKHSELVLVQNNPLFDDDDDDDQINNPLMRNSTKQLQLQMRMKLCMIKFNMIFPTAL
jgi:hypothetical protein